MNTDFIKIQNEIENNFSFHIDYLRKYLSSEKIKHCLSTATYALYIVRTQKISVLEDKVILSGILHDLCREYPKEELIKKAKEYNIEITKYEEKYPVLLHGPLSAHTVYHKLNIKDKDIYEAIYWHTTGKANLGLVGQILYLSDFSEPLREYPQAEQSRIILSREGFIEALFFTAKERYRLSLKKRDPAPYSLEFIEWLRGEKEILANAK